MKIKFIHYKRTEQELKIRLLLVTVSEANRIQQLLRKIIVKSMNMTLAYRGATQILTINKCDSLSALLFNIKKRLFDNGLSQENWEVFLDEIRKAGFDISFGSKEKLDTLLPKEMRRVIADYLTGKEVARLSGVCRLFREETKSVLYCKRKLLEKTSAGVVNKIIETGLITTSESYKNLYRIASDDCRRNFYRGPKYLCDDIVKIFCLSGDAALVRYAVENQIVNASYKDNENRNAYHLTATTGSVESMREAAKIPGLDLAAKFPYINTGTHYENAFILAAYSGSAAAIREASKVPNMDVNAISPGGGNALHALILRGGAAPEAIRVFAEIPKFDVNYRSRCTGHIIMTAISYSPEAIREVSKLPGVDSNIGWGSWSPFMLQFQPELCNIIQYNPLMYALCRNYSRFGERSFPLEVIREVIKLPWIDFSQRTSNGETVLLLAIRTAPLEVIQEVAKIPGVYLGAVDYKDNNILHVAVEHSTPEVVIFLRRLNQARLYKLDFNIPNQKGYTPLMLASSYEMKVALTMEVQPFEEGLKEERTGESSSEGSTRKFDSESNQESTNNKRKREDFSSEESESSVQYELGFFSAAKPQESNKKQKVDQVSTPR